MAGHGRRAWWRGGRPLYTHQSAAHHGEVGAGSVRAVQFGDRPRRAGGRDQQETVAGNHQRPPPAVEHHFRRVHSAHPSTKLLQLQQRKRSEANTYMKYLYPYECEKRRLSTPAELQAAIDGNRREGRRSSYGTYATTSAAASTETLVQRNPHATSSLALHTQMSPLSLVTASGQHHGPPQALVNGSAVHAPTSHHLHHSQHLQGVPATGSSAGPPVPGMAPTEFEARMVEYVKLLNKELRNAGNSTPPPMVHRQDTISPTPSTPPRDVTFSALDVSRLTLWNMYNNNSLYSGIGHQSIVSPQPSPQPPQISTPEPQREALDLGLRSSPISSPLRQSSPCLAGNLPMKRDQDFSISIGPTPAKRLLNEDNCSERIIGTNIKISNRGDGRNGDNSLVVSVELNGIIYQGVLFAQTDTKAGSSAATCSNSKSSRSIVS
ncbi:Protein dead ringer [Melipona quadrifasciata]|uniref:Protein dead ringer n=1 Tax=Melipona quadrifasciata TaxID=166423 RepID=A0A0N0U3X5_9HYME|nr:Protein dead ringer [Melipona quadrifasciata]